MHFCILPRGTKAHRSEGGAARLKGTQAKKRGARNLGKAPRSSIETQRHTDDERGTRRVAKAPRRSSEASRHVGEDRSSEEAQSPAQAPRRPTLGEQNCNLVAVWMPPVIPDATAGVDRGIDEPSTPDPKYAPRHSIVSSMDKGKEGDCFPCRLRHQGTPLSIETSGRTPRGALWHGNRFFGHCSDLVLGGIGLIGLAYLESLNTWIGRLQFEDCNFIVALIPQLQIPNMRKGWHRTLYSLNEVKEGDCFPLSIEASGRTRRGALPYGMKTVSLGTAPILFWIRRLQFRWGMDPLGDIMHR